jgi:hypothetical protein
VSTVSDTESREKQCERTVELVSRRARSSHQLSRVKNSRKRKVNRNTRKKALRRKKSAIKVLFQRRKFLNSYITFFQVFHSAEKNFWRVCAHARSTRLFHSGLVLNKTLIIREKRSSFSELFFPHRKKKKFTLFCSVSIQFLAWLEIAPPYHHPPKNNRKPFSFLLVPFFLW